MVSERIKALLTELENRNTNEKNELQKQLDEATKQRELAKGKANQAQKKIEQAEQKKNKVAQMEAEIEKMKRSANEMTEEANIMTEAAETEHREASAAVEEMTEKIKRSEEKMATVESRMVQLLSEGVHPASQQQHSPASETTGPSINTTDANTIPTTPKIATSFLGRLPLRTTPDPVRSSLHQTPIISQWNAVSHNTGTTPIPGQTVASNIHNSVDHSLTSMATAAASLVEPGSSTQTPAKPNATSEWQITKEEFITFHGILAHSILSPDFIALLRLCEDCGVNGFAFKDLSTAVDSHHYPSGSNRLKTHIGASKRHDNDRGEGYPRTHPLACPALIPVKREDVLLVNSKQRPKNQITYKAPGMKEAVDYFEYLPYLPPLKSAGAEEDVYPSTNPYFTSTFGSTSQSAEYGKVVDSNGTEEENEEFPEDKAPSRKRQRMEDQDEDYVGHVFWRG